MTHTLVLPAGKPNEVCDDRYFVIHSHINQSCLSAPGIKQNPTCTNAIYSVYCYSQTKTLPWPQNSFYLSLGNVNTILQPHHIKDEFAEKNPCSQLNKKTKPKPNQNKKPPHCQTERNCWRAKSYNTIFNINQKNIYLMTFVKDFHSLRSSFMEANSHACLFQLSWE